MALFQKGVSGNPKGRPKKGTALSDLLDTALAAKGPNGKTRREELMNVLLQMALLGDLDAIKVILDRIDGKVVERLEHSGPEGGALLVEYVNDWRSRDSSQD